MYTELCAGLCYVWVWVKKKTGAVCTRAFCGFGWLCIVCQASGEAG